MIKILHFADAHIDIANHGRHDPETGLALRVMDFLKALDTIIDTAIEENVDLVLFAGDAYRDRTPVPTFQREWGRRILRLSRAGIQTLLLIGNHDLSPAVGRAHALQEFDTLEVPHVKVLDKPQILRPADLESLPLQVLAIPWISRSRMLATLDLDSNQPEKAYEQIEERLAQLIQGWLDEEIDPNIPSILMAHTSIQGAMYGAERSVMLGRDLVLAGSLVRDPRLDYVALGHIHKAQDLNEGMKPPVVYPGSIERVDFGEAQDEKYFVIVEIDEQKRDYPKLRWMKLDGRRFIDRSLRISDPQDIWEQMIRALPLPEEFTEAIVRFVIEYPRDMETLLDESALRRYLEPAFEFHFIRRPIIESRIRLPGDEAISKLSPLELLDYYWKSASVDSLDVTELNKLAARIISDSSTEE
jgi:exonuclease SbcD